MNEENMLEDCTMRLCMCCAVETPDYELDDDGICYECNAFMNGVNPSEEKENATH